MAVENYMHRKWVVGRKVLLDVKWSRTDGMVSSFRRSQSTIDFNSDSPLKGGKGDFGADY